MTVITHKPDAHVTIIGETANVSTLAVCGRTAKSAYVVRDSRDKRCLPVSQEISNSVSKVAEGPVQIPHLHH